MIFPSEPPISSGIFHGCTTVPMPNGFWLEATESTETIQKTAAQRGSTSQIDQPSSNMFKCSYNQYLEESGGFVLSDVECVLRFGRHSSGLSAIASRFLVVLAAPVENDIQIQAESVVDRSYISLGCCASLEHPSFSVFLNFPKAFYSNHF